MPEVKVKEYGSMEFDEKKSRKIDPKNEIKFVDLYRDDSIERDDE